MPRYYCDYCDTYLTHDSPSVRKQHNAGYKHKANVRQYYQQFEEQQTQSLIDQRIKEHLGQAAYQVGATYLASLPPNAQRPRLPVLPTPVLPMPGGSQPPLPLMRPLFCHALCLELQVGYGGMPGMQFPGPPGPPSGPMQMNGPPRPPITPRPPLAGNPSAGGGGGYDAFSASSPSGMQRSAQDGPPPPSNAPQDGGHHMYSQPSESNH
ncbi:unnamed protein product [Spirodela intermedia]|uniref:U1 small nuclear ribonucleoprotein C n=1 Tax=Spirodela intermedia TaxID=51605 RepID=A0A7I8IZU4_SPIIN|nr:unnamed protein product [Spirodela intermedia]CAA6663484.1 unnamed protein product [Spirodela intermedia]